MNFNALNGSLFFELLTEIVDKNHDLYGKQ